MADRRSTPCGHRWPLGGRLVEDPRHRSTSDVSARQTMFQARSGRYALGRSIATPGLRVLLMPHLRRVGRPIVRPEALGSGARASSALRDGCQRPASSPAVVVAIAGRGISDRRSRASRDRLTAPLCGLNVRGSSRRQARWARRAHRRRRPARACRSRGRRTPSTGSPWRSRRRGRGRSRRRRRPARRRTAAG
jgi:hypothetical protein